MTGLILNPLTGKHDTIAVVLLMLASQENCDGVPYDQMQYASDYIGYLKEQHESLLERLERWLEGTKGYSVHNREKLQQIIDEASINDDVDMAKKKAYP